MAPQYRLPICGLSNVSLVLFILSVLWGSEEKPFLGCHRFFFIFMEQVSLRTHRIGAPLAPALDWSAPSLTFDGGGPYVPPQSVFIFLPKISPPDQTLRPTCKLLILGLLYHEFFFLLKI